ncbi:MAG: M15 family metallopeptidase [Solirubrobacterales bacterium]
MPATASASILLAVLVLSGGAVAAKTPREQEAGVRAPRFQGTSSPLDRATRQRVKGNSWHRGCLVGLGRLRLLRLTHWGFDAEAHRGRLIVNRHVAREVLRAMRSLYRHRFPIRRMRLVDAYGANDRRSMNADNTSAFNCRFVAGQPGTWSQHAYGKAIDLNPVENPYVTDSGYVSPPAGAEYANRSRRRKGMIHRGDSTARAFAAIGWGWGGRWSWPKDYQHFSASGS